MAYTTINKSTEHFDTKVYTGNGSSQTLDMDNLGLLWMKNRTEGSNHNLFDVVRGGYYTSAPGPNLRPNGSNAASGSDITSAYGITFGSSSSTIGSDGGGYNYNQNSKSYVGWQWRANGTGSANTDGSINTTATSANTTAGFSMSTWSGNGYNATIGHGLGVAPKVVIVKRLSGVADWVVGHDSMGWTKYIYLSSNAAQVDSASAAWNDTAPTNSVFTVATNTQVNASGSTYIAYCFAEKTGYNKFGSFIGNGNSDGAFIYTGFRPAFFLSKRSSASGDPWVLIDNKRNTFNALSNTLTPNDSNAENTGTDRADFLSNGIKIKTTSDAWNNSGSTYIYMAFADAPLVGTNNVPANAR